MAVKHITNQSPFSVAMMKTLIVETDPYVTKTMNIATMRGKAYVPPLPVELMVTMKKVIVKSE